MIITNELLHGILHELAKGTGWTVSMWQDPDQFSMNHTVKHRDGINLTRTTCKYHIELSQHVFHDTLQSLYELILNYDPIEIDYYYFFHYCYKSAAYNSGYHYTNQLIPCKKETYDRIIEEGQEKHHRPIRIKAGDPLPEGSVLRSDVLIDKMLGSPEMRYLSTLIDTFAINKALIDKKST